MCAEWNRTIKLTKLQFKAYDDPTALLGLQRPGDVFKPESVLESILR
jgi:hypothetical protein